MESQMSALHYGSELRRLFEALRQSRAPPSRRTTDVPLLTVGPRPPCPVVPPPRREISMSRSWKLATALVAALAATVTAVLPASAATWSSSDKWASWSNGGYTIRNDVWGSGAGPQSIWANSYSNFGVWA